MYVLIVNLDFRFHQVQQDLLCNHFYNKNVYYWKMASVKNAMYNKWSLVYAQ